MTIEQSDIPAFLDGREIIMLEDVGNLIRDGESFVT